MCAVYVKVGNPSPTQLQWVENTLTTRTLYVVLQGRIQQNSVQDIVVEHKGFVALQPSTGIDEMDGSRIKTRIYVEL